MRGHVLPAYKKAPVYADITERPVGPEDVRIAVEAVALNPVDAKTIAGEPKMLLPFAPPFVVGVDLAGRVTAVGAAVRSLQTGDAVHAYAGMDRMGAFADSVVLPAARVSRRPARFTAAEAACLPLTGLCALQALDAGRVAAGSRVLIHGGAGGVGRLALQLARARGAEVYTTVSTRHIERARSDGAAHVIDRRTQRFEEVARDVDFVLDTVGGESLARSWGCLRAGGVVASLHVPPAATALIDAGLRAPLLLRALLPLVTRGPHAKARARGAQLVPVLTVPDGARLASVARSVEQDGLRVHIDRTFPFDALAPALTRLAAPDVDGRVVLLR